MLNEGICTHTYRIWPQSTFFIQTCMLLLRQTHVNAIYNVCRLIYSTVIVLGALESHLLSELSTKHKGVWPDCTVHFDWLKVWKASTPMLTKSLQYNVFPMTILRKKCPLLSQTLNYMVRNQEKPHLQDFTISKAYSLHRSCYHHS